MAARVIHLGPDDCHRLMVLRTAGYRVDACDSMAQLRAWIAGGLQADVVVMSDAGGAAPKEVVAIARTRAFLPVILFRSTNLAYEETGVDLIVPGLTPPGIWLHDVEALIQAAKIFRESGHLPGTLRAAWSGRAANSALKPVLPAGPVMVPKAGAK